MKLPFKGSLYVYVAAVFDVIRIYPAAIRNGGEVTYWFFMCCPLVLIFIYLTLVLLIDAALNLTKGKSLRLYLSIRIIQLLHCLFFWVLLIPTFDFFISIFECDVSTGNIRYSHPSHVGVPYMHATVPYSLWGSCCF